MRGFYRGDGSSASSYNRCPNSVDMKRLRDSIVTYLGGLLGSAGLPLREGRRCGFTALFGRLSLRKEEHQRILFTKWVLL